MAQTDWLRTSHDDILVYKLWYEPQCKNATCFHCYANKLNLILKQSVDCVKECKIFSIKIYGLSNSFAKSSKIIVALDHKYSYHKQISVCRSSTMELYNNRLIEIIMYDH